MAGSPRLPGYRLQAPDDEEARSILHRLFGPEQGESVWREARRSIGVQGEGPLSLEQLQRLADHYAARTGSEGLFGRSLSIRIRTYVLLKEKLTLPPQGAVNDGANRS